MERKKNRLVLVRGLPGAGKSTLAEMISEDRDNCVSVCADDWRTDGKGNYAYDPAANRYCHTACLGYAELAMIAKTRAVIVHNTFTRESEIEPYVDLAAKHDYDLMSIIVENRHGNPSVHGVSDETMAKMESRFSIRLREPNPTSTQETTTT